MLRDLTMIVSVLVSMVSLSFGVYKNIEAGNAKGFAYEQTYRVLNIVQNANLTPFQRATIADAALTAMGTPPPVIDLSRSSAGTVEPAVCSDILKLKCVDLAQDLADVNAACARSVPDACMQADLIHRDIIQQDCISCFDK